MCSKSTFRKKATFSARPHGGDIRATYTQVLRFQYLQKEARSASQMSRGNLAVKQMLPEISRVFGFSPNSVLLGVLNAFWRCPPCCWMVCPPSRGSCLPLSPLLSLVPLLVSLCWMVCPPFRDFPRVLSPLVSPCLPCTPSCFPLLDGVSPSPLVSPCLPVGWCVRLVSLCLPLCPLVSPLDGVSAFPRVLVSPCWMVCPSCRGSCLPLSPFLFAFIGWHVRLPEGLVSPCLLFVSLVSLTFVLDGGSAFPKVLSLLVVFHCLPCTSLLVSVCWMVCPAVLKSCLPLSPLPHPSPHCSPLCPHMSPRLDGVSAFPRLLCVPPLVSPFVSPCLPSCSPSSVWCVRLFDVLVFPFCLPFLKVSALVPLVGWCVRLAEGLVSLCLPLYPFLFAFIGWHVRLSKVLSPLLSPTSLLVSLAWMVCPPFQGVSPGLPLSPIVPHSLPLSPHMCACVGWCVRLPEVLSPLVSRCLPSCLSLSPVVSNCFPLSPIVSNCPPLSPNMCACVGWSTFPKSCFSLSPIVSLDMRACVGWCVRLPEVLSPLVSPHVCLCWMVPQPWMVCPPSRGLVSPCLPVLDGVSAFPRSCFPLSPISLLVSLCWMVRPPSRRLCLPLSPIVSSHVSLCWMVCPLPRGLVSTCLPLSPLVHPIASHCLPSCLPVSRCLRLRFIVSHCLPTCVPVLDGVSGLDHICLQEALSPHVSHCLPTRVPVLDGVSHFPRSCLPLFPHMCACNLLWSSVLDGASAFPRFCLPCLPACLSAGLPSCLAACLPTCLSSYFPLWWVVWFCIFFQTVYC